CCLSRTRRLPPISTSFPYTTLFRSQKKSKQRKGEPKSGALRASLRCSRRGGNSQTCPLRGLRTCEFLIPTPLRCSARPHGKVGRDRKSTRLNSSHVKISYAVFCLKK